MPSWRLSVRLAEERSRLEGVIVSRHFCALSTQDPARRPFADDENPRREAAEQRLELPREDLDRWTAAIGFCDLVSLYLCSGAQDPVELPLAHPSLASDTRKVVLEWTGGTPRFSSPLVEPGATVSVRVCELWDQGRALEQIVLTWEFLQ